jgi:hypothetical protein
MLRAALVFWHGESGGGRDSLARGSSELVVLRDCWRDYNPLTMISWMSTWARCSRNVTHSARISIRNRSTCVPHDNYRADPGAPSLSKARLHYAACVTAKGLSETLRIRPRRLKPRWLATIATRRFFVFAHGNRHAAEKD